MGPVGVGVGSAVGVKVGVPVGVAAGCASTTGMNVFVASIVTTGPGRVLSGNGIVSTTDGSNSLPPQPARINPSAMGRTTDRYFFMASNYRKPAGGFRCSSGRFSYHPDNFRRNCRKLRAEQQETELLAFSQWYEFLVAFADVSFLGTD